MELNPGVTNPFKKREVKGLDRCLLHTAWFRNKEKETKKARIDRLREAVELIRSWDKFCVCAEVTTRLRAGSRAGGEGGESTAVVGSAAGSFDSCVSSCICLGLY